MKKVLIGLAVAAMAVAGIGGSASAGTPSDSIWDILTEAMSDDAVDALEGLGIRTLLDDCDDRLTMFAPGLNLGGSLVGTEAYLDAIVSAVLGYTDLVTAIDKEPATIKYILSYHVVPTYYSPSTLADEYATSLRNAAGAILSISNGDGGFEFEVDGIPTGDPDGTPDLVAIDACNGVVFPLGVSDDPDAPSLLGPASAPDPASCGVSAPGACPVTPDPAGSGSGLPKTGSESMALTYAALASLMAGAGVLVIRRRSIA